MLIIINSILQASTMSGCGWMTLGRIWQPNSSCVFDDDIDMGTWQNYGLSLSGNSTRIDMSVVNINTLPQDIRFQWCTVDPISGKETCYQELSYSLGELTNEASVKNAVLVVNVSIDCEQKDIPTKKLFVSIFDEIAGQINNISVVGQVHLKNFDVNSYDEVLLSTLFGNVTLTNTDRLMNGTDGLNGRLQTIFSSLRFIVNDTYEVRQTTEGKIVLKSLNPLLPHITNETYLEKIHLVTCFDSMIKSDDESSINIPYIPSALDEELNKKVIDEILTTTDDLTIYLASLYGPYNLTGFDIFVPEVPQSVLAVVRNYTTIDMTIQDSFTDATYTIPATIGFNMTEHPNAFHDLYGRALVKSIELSHETEGLSERFYSKKGIPQDIQDPEDQSVKVYSSNTKTVAFWEGHILVCQDGKLFDVVTKSCVESCQIGEFRFLSICGSSCPDLYTIEKDGIIHCYVECPVQAGYVNPTLLTDGNKCQLCSEPQVATKSGCSAEQGYQFNQGYFATCPEGTNLESEIECFEPKSISDCPTGQKLVDMSDHPYHISKGYEYYSFCTNNNSLLVGLHRIMNAQRLLTDVYHWKCPQNSIQFLNGTCFSSPIYEPQLKDCVTSKSVVVFASISYVQAALNETIGDVLICEPICGNGLVEVDGACVAECPVPLYMQERFGSCNPCISNVYDNGTFFNIDTKHCNIECANFTIDVDHSENGSQLDTSPKLCLPDCTEEVGYPKHWVRNYTALDNTIKTHWQCLKKCSDVNLLDNDGECVEKCPLGKLISEDGTTCLEKCPMTIGADGKPREGFYRVMFRNGTEQDNTGKMWQGQCYTSPFCSQDLQTYDEKVHNISFRCMDTCPTSPVLTISTRHFTCVPLNNCQFLDRYPKPLFCEEKTDQQHCTFYRKIDLITDRKVYDCQTVECENNERIFEKQECVLSCYDHDQFQSVSIEEKIGRYCVDQCIYPNNYYSKVYQLNGLPSVLLDPTQSQAFEYQCQACPFPKGKWLNPKPLFNNSVVYKEMQCEDSCASMLNSTDFYVNVKDQMCNNCTYLDTQYSPPVCVDKCEVSMMAPAPLNQKICIDKCPENNYIHSVNGVKECVSSCKAIGMAVTNDGIYCAGECVFYRFQKQEFFCYDKCLIYDMQLQIDNNTYCYLDCGNQNYDPVAEICVNKCPNDNYSFKHLCLSTCPSGYKNICGQCILNTIYKCLENDDNQCVQSCKELGMAVSNDGIYCVDECEHYYRSQKQEYYCFETCLENDNYINFLNRSYCYPNCGSQIYDSINDMCVDSCPTNAYYFYSLCLDTCPPGYTNSDNKCIMDQVDKCPENQYVHTANGVDECVQSCKDIGMAVSNDGIYCVDECDCFYRMQNYEYFCHDICENNDKYLQIQQMANKIYCYPDCGNQNYDPVSDKCVDICPITSFYNLCLNACSTGYTNINNQCILNKIYKCLENDDNQCVQSCKELGMAVSNDGIYCVDECEHYYRSQKQEYYCFETCLENDNYINFLNRSYCYPNCGSQIYDSINDMCVDSCPTNAYYFYSLCLDTCPPGYTNSDNKCIMDQVDKCPENQYVHTANGVDECVQSCKDIGMAVSNDGIYCVDECDCFYRMQNYEYFCHDICENNDKYLQIQQMANKIYCYPDCGNQNYDPVSDKCVDICPITSFYNLCLNACSTGYTNINNQCIIGSNEQGCASYTIDVSHSQNGNQFDTSPEICLPDCTEEVGYPKHWERKYIAMDQTEKTHWQCLKKCSDVNLLDNDGECVEKCPLGKLISEDGTTCLEKCPYTVGADGKPREGFYRVMFRNGTEQDNTGKMWQGQCFTSPACPEDLQTYDEKVHNISYRCMDTCPVSPNITIATRHFTCVPLDECQFFDRYPKPLFCEEKTDQQHCTFYRKIDLITDRKVYDCQTVECENNERIFEKQECVLSCYALLQYEIILNNKTVCKPCPSEAPFNQTTNICTCEGKKEFLPNENKCRQKCTRKTFFNKITQ
ncbi:Conserved_hypothetical protein [Hexamita inflata]|uniref:Uncharacterized protein n=1 Tax=Hexamita inflata TaxID=28002 RepID=A0AA86NB86_9EUKA|nr:Conserved hypothetical protein [Hexamita inflata]